MAGLRNTAETGGLSAEGAAAAELVDVPVAVHITQTMTTAMHINPPSTPRTMTSGNIMSSDKTKTTIHVMTHPKATHRSEIRFSKIQDGRQLRQPPSSISIIGYNLNSLLFIQTESLKRKL